MRQSHLEIIDPDTLKFLVILLAQPLRSIASVLSAAFSTKRPVGNMVGRSGLFRADPHLFELACPRPQILGLEDQVVTLSCAALGSKHEPSDAQVCDEKGKPRQALAVSKLLGAYHAPRLWKQCVLVFLQSGYSPLNTRTLYPPKEWPTST